jgi:hypothetical protein
VRDSERAGATAPIPAETGISELRRIIYRDHGQGSQIAQEMEGLIAHCDAVTSAAQVAQERMRLEIDALKRERDVYHAVLFDLQPKLLAIINEAFQAVAAQKVLSDVREGDSVLVPAPLVEPPTELMHRSNGVEAGG